MNARHQSGSNGLHVTLHSADLPGEKDAPVLLHLKCGVKQRGPIDVSVPMNLAVTKEPGIFQSRDEPQNAGLFTVLEVVLKSDEIVGVSAEVLLPKLDDRVGLAPCPRVAQANRLHR